MATGGVVAVGDSGAGGEKSVLPAPFPSPSPVAAPLPVRMRLFSSRACPHPLCLAFHRREPRDLSGTSACSEVTRCSRLGHFNFLSVTKLIYQIFTQF